MMLAAGMSPAAEVKVMASAAFKEAYLELVPEFERTSGKRLGAESIVALAGCLERRKT